MKIQDKTGPRSNHRAREASKAQALALGSALLLMVGCTGSAEIKEQVGDNATPGANSMENYEPSPVGGVDPETAKNCKIEEAWPGRRRLRRLTRQEYSNSLQDLSGMREDWGRTLPPDQIIHGFDTNARALVATPLHVEQWLDAAETIADRYVGDLPNRLSCAPQADEACARSFLDDFGARAFRRPLTDDDRQRYLTLFAEVSAIDGFDQGIRDMLVALLISPHFLYRSELGERADDDRFALTPYEIASELSYLLWQTGPDQQLLEAAAAGELREPDQIAAQARRMLDDPRASRSFVAFHDQWLELERIEHVPRDPEIYADLTPKIREQMRQENAAFLTHVFDGGQGKLSELFVADYSYLNDELARYYGLPEPGSDQMTRVSLESQPHRRGILGQGSFLTVHAMPTSSSPIHRGVAVREAVFCQPLPPPPPGVGAEVPPLEPGMSTRERFQTHSSDPQCAGCHRLIDPIGFGFEHFDGDGRYRETQEGVAIDALGEVLNSHETNGEFDGLSGLTAKLAESLEVRACFSLQWFRYGYGLEEDKPHHCTVASIQKSFSGDEASFADLMIAMVTTPHFRYRASDDIDPQSWNPGGEPDPVEPDPSEPDPTEPDPSEPDPVEPDPVEPDPKDPQVSQSDGLDVEDSIRDDWGTGYCAEVKLRNTSDAAIIWEIAIDVTGEMTTSWNVTPSAMSGAVTFKGVGWNAQIAPNAIVDFGFCAER